MTQKILIDSHRFLIPVQEWIQKKHDVEFLTLGEAITRYKTEHSVDFCKIIQSTSFSKQFISGFPSWFRENVDVLKQIVRESATKQMDTYGSFIKAMDLCLQHENISLILLWNDVTALTKSLTFLGKKHGIPSLHLNHGIPGRVPVHRKIWADKLAVFGESSKKFYLDNGNPEEKIVITGNPYWDNWGPCAKKDIDGIKEDLGLDIYKKVIMYAPSWYHNFNTAADPEFLAKQDLKVLLNELKKLDFANEIELIVKIHPGHGDKAGFYDQELKKGLFSHKIFTNISPLSLIQVADVVICSGSMFVEALLVGKPLIYYACGYFCSPSHFNSINYPHFKMKDAPFYVAIYEDDLSRALNKILKGKKDFLKKDVEKFLHKINGPCDGKAAERVATLAMEMAKKEEPIKFISPVSYKKAETYYSSVREDIPAMLTGNPQKILEIGCAEGAMGEFIKEKQQCEYIGVEINSQAAHKAEEKLDRIIIADVERTNLRDYGVAEKSCDYIIYGDVLEHLYDPWSVLYEHKQFLKDDGYIIASIPNVRNLGIIESLMNGNWTYKDEGILDSTHLRFFTLQEVKKMFTKCGYKIVEIKCTTNPFFDLNKIQGRMNIDLPKITIKNVSREEALELSTVQFVVKAQKAIIPESVKDIKCSIIIPVFNKLKYTKQCLEALIENTPDELYEVIVVDNASTDGTKEFLACLEGDVKIITNEENLGFAKACNQGAKAASGKYLVFLNNDTKVTPNWLDEMVKCVQEDEKRAVVGAKLLYPDDTIQHAGVAVTDSPHPIFPHHIHHKKPSDAPEVNVMKEYQAVTGACMLVQRNLFEKLGGFDEKFLNGYEDVDFCFRVREAGYRVFYCPTSVIYHYESISEGRFAAVEHNVRRLHQKWLGKIRSDKDDTELKLVHKLISIIILTHNQLEYTKKCIDSIFRHTKESFELIVVDNGSMDGTVEYLKKVKSSPCLPTGTAIGRNLKDKSSGYCKDIKIIENKENRGFAMGNNQGMAVAKGDSVLLLNNDIVVTPGWLGRMSAKFKEEKVGIVGPRTNYVVGPQLVPMVTYPKNDMKEMKKFAEKWSREHVGKSFETDRVIGFCMLIGRDVIKKIGGLDPRFGSGNFEDDDYCLRTRIAGYKIVVADDVFVHHFGSRTFIGAKIDYGRSMESNWIKFKNKWGMSLDSNIKKGYIFQELLAQPFDPKKHYQTLEINENFNPDVEPIPISDKRGFSFLAFPNWKNDEDKWSNVLLEYIKAFNPKDDVSLILRIDPEFGDTAEVAQEKLTSLIRRAGYDPENIPDIVIVDQFLTDNEKAGLYTAADVFIPISKDEDTQYMLEAKACGIEILEDVSDEGMRSAFESKFKSSSK
ncbi:MAG TPA: glycosyltransferase [Actinobacteria bacterium]|nr:glycosyltransferase [Actinomycetota bacterium]